MRATERISVIDALGIDDDDARLTMIYDDAYAAVLDASNHNLR